MREITNLADIWLRWSNRKFNATHQRHEVSLHALVMLHFVNNHCFLHFHGGIGLSVFHMPTRFDFAHRSS
jgi:hypothetical protein